MKKVTSFLMVAAIAFGFAACNSEDVPDVSKGTTYAGLIVSTDGGGTKTRALTDTQEDDPGYEGEIALATLDLISTSDNKSWAPSSQGGEGFWQVGSTNNYTVDAWKTTVGTHTMALILNKGSITSSIGTAAAQVYGPTTDAKADIAGLTAPAGFTMTSATASINVSANITKEAANTGSDASANVFIFEVERVVAKGVVRKGAGLTGSSIATQDTKGTISLSGATDLTFSAVNGATKTYLFGNNAGARELAVADPNQYVGFESAIHSITPKKDPNDAKTAGLIRLGNISNGNALPTPGTNADLGGYQAKAVNANGTELSAANGIYFMENSGDVNTAAIGGDPKEYGFYRFAYAKIYATYTPNKIYQLVNTGDPSQGVVEVDYTDADQKADDGTFYKGETDHLLYVSKEAAAASAIAPNQKAFTYNKGRCGYRALWNRQIKDDSTPNIVNNASTRRNNTYLLDINGFVGLGFPWDSSDPNDPNLPKKDTDTTTDPDDPNIEKQDTYMRVVATVLKWNVVNRGVILE